MAAIRLCSNRFDAKIVIALLEVRFLSVNSVA